MKKVYLIHRWGGNSNEEWFNWLKEELPKKGFEVFSFDMPETENPRIETWVKFLEDKIPSENLDEETYFIGHSVGCQTIMRFLEKLPKQEKIGGLILVAPWFSLINIGTDELEIAHPWINSPIDFSRVIRHTDNILAIFSNDDPYVHFDEAAKFRDKLGAKIIIKHNEGHFNKTNKIPEILEFLK